ncbi:MAG: hypothetical protein SOY83_05090 [Anaerovoracaceae bacterium]|nr:hypothetical protein [Anaerovoracaceae bacterium]
MLNGVKKKRRADAGADVCGITQKGLVEEAKLRRYQSILEEEEVNRGSGLRSNP